jgi:hypothetical protein
LKVKGKRCGDFWESNKTERGTQEIMKWVPEVPPAMAELLDKVHYLGRSLTTKQTHELCFFSAVQKLTDSTS